MPQGRDETKDQLATFASRTLSRGSFRSELQLVPTTHRGSPLIAVRGEPDRYFDLALIAHGGMSEVRRVWDEKLRRSLAMKILEWDLLDDNAARGRFINEAMITANLQHPGVVPVHDWGELADGRLYFTMHEVRGRTLGAIIDALHAGQDGTHWKAIDDGPSLYRVIELLRRVCEAVAHAHGQGIVHRDLKPANVVVGELAGVQVMDWGVATRTDGLGESNVIGTPAFMAPEQAAGRPVTAAADVYSVGAILYQVLRGRTRYVGRPERILASLVSDAGASVRDDLAGSVPVPPEALVAICEKALARDPAHRFPSAAELAVELGAWLEGTRRRETALQILSRADAILPEIERLRIEAAFCRERASALLGEIHPLDPSRDKKTIWVLEEQAVEAEREAHLQDAQWFQLVRSALNVDDTLPEAHARLAARYHEQLVNAEAAGRESEAQRAEAFLRVHDRGEHAAFLRGLGALSLHTDPPGISVTAFRYVEHGGRLVLEQRTELGVTPLERVELAHGSYLLVLRAPGFETVRYPVLIERAAHWDGVRPGGGEPTVVRMFRRGQVPSGFVRVPGGWFASGGDPHAIESLPARRVWIDDYFIARYPVTNRDYLAFLNALVEAGHEEDALRACPRAPLGVGTGAEALARLQLDRDDQGRFVLARDELGHAWRPDWPVRMIDWESAQAYVRWLGARSGASMRLPNELEWEKAARGVDRRVWPWGPRADVAYANVLGTLPLPAPSAVTSFPIDTSPYGVRQIAGNVREWCINPWRETGPSIERDVLQVDAAASDDHGWRAARGGGWHATGESSRIASRFAAEPYRRFSGLGFRPVLVSPARDARR
jgi:eukaryotic-like serine/threonine-protein kinase